MTNTDKRTASQRIEDLERALMSLYQTADNMARDVMLIKDAVKLLGNKVDAIAKAANIGDETISALMIENNVKELSDKVQSLVQQGILATSESIEESSFVVGREIGEDGVVANPRLQFALSALQPELKDKLIGAKAGQTVELQEGKLKYEVLEVYNIQSPQAPQAEVEAPATTESTEETASAEAANS